jgi:hypothetical protein
MAATRSTPASPASTAKRRRKTAVARPRKTKDRDRPKPEPAPPHEAVAVNEQTTPQQRATTAMRVHDMVARELDAVERVLDVLAPEGPNDAERAARTLASIARTLRELSLMNDTGDEPEAATADDDDDIPRDLDEFRRELARRIDAFVDERTGGGLPDGGGAGMEHGPRA